MAMHHLDLDPKLVVQILQFLWTVYSSRRSGAKPRSEKEPSDERVVAGEIPNPDKIRELIEEVKEESKQTEEGIAAAIDKKFPPAEARQVKDDFATFALFASPPNFADYDFVGIIQKYVKGMQSIALTVNLFRLRGTKYRHEIRLLDMPETAASLASPEEVQDAVYTPGQIVTALVTERRAVLTNEQEEIPLAFLIGAEFRYASYGHIERQQQVYKLKTGQERNWLAFYFAYRNFASVHPAFSEFEYRLNASGVKTILAAMKRDIGRYLADLEEERPLIHELRRELDGLSAITQT